MFDSFLTVPVQCMDSEKAFKVWILGQGATHLSPKQIDSQAMDS